MCWSFPFHSGWCGYALERDCCWGILSRLFAVGAHSRIRCRALHVLLRCTLLPASLLYSDSDTNMSQRQNPIGYGNVKTLTDTSVRNCVGDMRAFKPTFLVGVPAVWELIRKGLLTRPFCSPTIRNRTNWNLYLTVSGIQSKAASSGLVKSTLFNTALTVKKLVGSNNLLGMLIDHVVFGPVKAAVGGNLKYGVCGGAPISRETQEFLSASLCMVIQGYGMTWVDGSPLISCVSSTSEAVFWTTNLISNDGSESSAFSAALPPDFYQHGVVGIPMPSTEIKLVDFEEASYFSSNNPPQGEILIRGPSVSSGYCASRNRLIGLP